MLSIGENVLAKKVINSINIDNPAAFSKELEVFPDFPVDIIVINPEKEELQFKYATRNQSQAKKKDSEFQQVPKFLNSLLKSIYQNGFRLKYLTNVFNDRTLTHDLFIHVKDNFQNEFTIYIKPLFNQYWIVKHSPDYDYSFFNMGVVLTVAGLDLDTVIPRANIVSGKQANAKNIVLYAQERSAGDLVLVFHQQNGEFAHVIKVNHKVHNYKSLELLYLPVLGSKGDSGLLMLDYRVADEITDGSKDLHKLYLYNPASKKYSNEIQYDNFSLAIDFSKSMLVNFSEKFGSLKFSDLNLIFYASVNNSNDLRVKYRKDFKFVWLRSSLSNTASIESNFLAGLTKDQSQSEFQTYVFEALNKSNERLHRIHIPNAVLLDGSKVDELNPF